MSLFRPDDRRVLEAIILPYFAGNTGFARVLFVGCAWYTRGYARLFSNQEYWTLDLNPAQKKYGSARHIVDSLTYLRAHFDPGSFDLIICNGVFGWGLDARPDIETAFLACWECLREEGIFILGWNDIAERRPYDPLESESLKLFQPYTFPPLEAACFLTASPIRHIYNFYVKPRI